MTTAPDDPDPVPPAAGKALPKGRAVEAGSREDRLKAALKANMARRKAQARARSQTGSVDDGSNEE